MNLNRRRFLAISGASTVASPALAQVHRWQGRALGADVEITLHAPAEIAVTALEQSRALLAKVEQQFNLFDPASALCGLNREGRLHDPDQIMHALMRACGTIHKATGGLFDPTVQPLWRALAEGRDTQAARKLIGWSQVRHTASSITLGKGQALTFNGIAQGFATDLVTKTLRRAGLDRTLVNIGEFRGTGGPWTIGVSDPEFGHIGTRTIFSAALATSSPAAVPLDGNGHILHGQAKPLWSTVSVEADTATIADGFSTALTMAPLPDIRALKGRFGLLRITLISDRGDVSTV
ncbi:MAG: FAD:protein FMN transferase [Sulfitobacter sp.]